MTTSPDRIPASPRHVFERFVQASINNAWDDLADLYAPDAVVEIPFAPPGVPKSSQGRELFRERFRAAAGSRQFHKAEPVIVHETPDPELIVAELSLHGTVTVTGRSFVNSFVMVMRVRDGLIVSSRDYSNPFVMAEAFGRLSELFAALTDRTG
jgi:ketosteroid isomerase-like protein